MPIWYVVAILITFSPEIGKAIGLSPAPEAGRAVVFCYVGISVGGLLSGWLSQLDSQPEEDPRALRGDDRGVRRPVLSRLGSCRHGAFYVLCFALGVASGYWAIFVTMASEQFGTNLRATATTTVPNFVRGAVVPLTSIFQALTPSLGLIGAGLLVGVVTIVLAAASIAMLDETFGRDLDFVEK